MRPGTQRLTRLQENRGWSPSDVERREASQLPLETKKKNSQFVIDNAGRLDVSGEELKHILTRIRTF